MECRLPPASATRTRSVPGPAVGTPRGPPGVRLPPRQACRLASRRRARRSRSRSDYCDTHDTQRSQPARPRGRPGRAAGPVVAPRERVTDLCRYGCCNATYERVGAGDQHEVPPAPRSKTLSCWNGASGICRRRELIVACKIKTPKAQCRRVVQEVDSLAGAQSWRFGGMGIRGQLSQIMAHQARQSRLKCSASRRCTEQAFWPRHFPQQPPAWTPAGPPTS